MPRSLTMMVMMPISGALYNKLDARPMILTGGVITIYSLWLIGHFTLQTGTHDILVPQVIQGIGFGLIFVALSTAALVAIEKSRMTSATGLYNLIRQLGGSFGTALVVTMLDRHINQARVDLVGNISSSNPIFMQRLHGMASAFMQQGYDAETARDMALKAIDGLIQQQAAMLAYDYIFLWIGLLSVLTLPLVFLLRVPKNKPAAREHMAMGD